MRAARYHDFGDEGVVVVDEVPTPQPGPGEVRVRVQAATVNRTDVNARAGLYGLPTPPPEGYGIGMDAGGTVDSLGSGVTGLTVGQEVAAFSRSPQTAGTQADYVVLPAENVVPVPEGTSTERIAALPLNGLTATQAVKALGDAGGRTVLIVGAAGGLGTFLVQIAHREGWRVVAVVRDPADRAELERLGADSVADDIDALPDASADALIDAANLVDPVLRLIADGGTYVTFRGADPAPQRGIAIVPVNVAPDHDQLVGLVQAVADGTLQLPDIETIPLDDVAAAQRRFDSGGIRDRLVLVP